MKRTRKIAKSLFSSIMSAVILASYPAAAMINADTSVKGDVNNDGVISSLDLLKMKQYLLGITVLETPNLTNADMSGDGKVNVIDCISLINIFLERDDTKDITEDKTISLSDTSITATGSGIVKDKSTITINEPGKYIITGKLSNGQVIVDVDKTKYPDGMVELSLEGAEISCSDNSPVYIASIDDECVITVKKGTTNTISDGKDYKNADEKSGAVYSKDDLKIKGKGKLIVNGNCKDGIVSKDSVKIFNGNITVTAVDDGIRGKDSVKIGDADDTDYSDLNITVKSAEGNGITATNDTDADKGNVIINGGVLTIDSKKDALSAVNTIYIYGGSLGIIPHYSTEIIMDDMSSSPLKNVKFIAYSHDNAQYKTQSFMSCFTVNKSNWNEIICKLPYDKYKDGEFVVITADIEILDGGVEGHVGDVAIKELKSIEKISDEDAAKEYKFPDISSIK